MKNEMKLNNKGFSLVELIVVIAIMAILVGVLAPSVLGQIDKAKQSKDKQAVDTIASSVAIAWADQDVTAKPTAGDITSAIGVTVGGTNGGTNTTYSGTPDSTFSAQIQSMVGYTSVALESNLYQGASFTAEINTTTGKVTCTLTPGSGDPYVVTK